MNFMIKYSNHLGTVTISKKYLVKLVTEQTESCFGVADLRSVNISRSADGEISVDLHIITSGDVNIPAVSEAVSHKVAYVLATYAGAQVGAVSIYTDNTI